MIASARSPRPHEKGGVALTLAGLGVIAAGFALPRDAGRRPALRGCTPSCPCGVRAWGCIFTARVVRHSRWRGAASLVRVSRSRAMPVGDRRSEAVRHPALVGFARGAAFSQQGWCGTHVGGGRRRWCGFRAPARCRSETGAPRLYAILPLWGSRVGLHFHSKGGAALTLAGGGVVGAGFALPRDAGRRPALRGCTPSCPCGVRAWGCIFTARVVRHSRWRGAASLVRVSRSRAMPVGDRRSKAVRHPALEGFCAWGCIFTARVVRH